MEATPGVRSGSDGGAGDEPHPGTFDRRAWRNEVYHFAPRSLWEAQRASTHLVPERFAEEGFVHLTVGLDRLLVPANTYFRDDPRPHVALHVDLDRVTDEVRFDAQPEIYPHLYGPLPVAVREVRDALRSDDGTFDGWGPPRPT